MKACSAYNSIAFFYIPLKLLCNLFFPQNNLITWVNITKLHHINFITVLLYSLFYEILWNTDNIYKRKYLFINTILPCVRIGGGGGDKKYNNSYCPTLWAKGKNTNRLYSGNFNYGEAKQWRRCYSSWCIIQQTQCQKRIF